MEKIKRGDGQEVRMSCFDRMLACASLDEVQSNQDKISQRPSEDDRRQSSGQMMSASCLGSLEEVVAPPLPLGLAHPMAAV